MKQFLLKRDSFIRRSGFRIRNSYITWYDSKCSRRECNCFVAFMISLSIPLAFTFAFYQLNIQVLVELLLFRESFRQKYRRHYRLVFFIAGSVGQIVVSMTGGMYIVRVFALSSYFSYVIALIILSISIGFNLYGLKMSGVFQVCIGVLTFFILLITIISSLPYIEIKI